MPLGLDCCKKTLRGHSLTVLTFGAVFLGIALGFILRSIPRETWWTPREVMYVGFPGELYLRMLTMFILPLLVTAVVSGIAALDLQASWQVALRAALWFIITDYIAVLIGIVLAVSIQPGKGIVANTVGEVNQDGILAVDTALDIFRNVFPPNYIRANLKQERTMLERNDSLPIEEWKIHIKAIDGVNIPGLITLAISLGLAIGVSLPSGKGLLDFCDTLGKAMMTAIGWVLWFTPVAVMFMVAAKLIAEEDLSGTLERLGLYFVTVLVALFVHGLMVLPVMYFAITKKSPFRLLGQVSQTLVTAFGTASSNAALPVTIDCLERRAGVDSRVVRFLAPVATSLNMNGTALYEAVAVVFISQLRDVPLDFAHLLLISITVTAACFGNAGVPQAGLVTMVLILGSLGLPPQDVILIVTVDWLLDRFRTTVNVISDCFATGVVEHLSQDQLFNIGKRKYSTVPQVEEDEEEYELNIRL